MDMYFHMGRGGGSGFLFCFCCQPFTKFCHTNTENIGSTRALNASRVKVNVVEKYQKYAY